MQITSKVHQTFQDFKAEVKKPTVLEDDVGFFLSFSLGHENNSQDHTDSTRKTKIRQQYTVEIFVEGRL